MLLQFVDPSVLSGREDQQRFTPLYLLANAVDPSDYSTHENQLILAKQFIKHGANGNAVNRPEGATPLHRGSCTSNVVELLLKTRCR